MIIEKLPVGQWMPRKGFREAYIAGGNFERTGSAVDSAKSEAAAIACLESNEQAALEAIASRVAIRETILTTVVTMDMLNA